MCIIQATADTAKDQVKAVMDRCLSHIHIYT